MNKGIEQIIECQENGTFRVDHEGVDYCIFDINVPCKMRYIYQNKSMGTTQYCLREYLDMIKEQIEEGFRNPHQFIRGE